MASCTVSDRYKRRAILPTYQQTDYQRPYWEMGGPQLNTDTGEDEADRENDGIPPFRDLTIVRH
jgi:hypothetical protein